MRRHLRNYAELILVAAFIIIVDQWTKWLVTSNLALSERWAPWPWLLPYARIVHWSNTGAAFGMFQEFNQVFKVLPIFVSLFIFYYYPRIERRDWLVRLALCMQLGGALGNWIDRIRLDYVIDFVSVGTFAVFNVADSCISVGVVVLILGMYLKERRDHQSLSDGQDDSTPEDPPAVNSTELAEDQLGE